MGALWDRLDFIAAMEGIVQLHPSAMLNPSALSAPERQLLLEWRNDWVERRNAAQSRGSGKSPAKQPEQPAKALTLADLAEFNAKEAERAARG